MQTPLIAFLGSGDIMVIGVVVLVLFGAKKVPELMKGLGTGIREFKKASRDVQDELERALHDDPPQPPRPALVREIKEEPKHEGVATLPEPLHPRPASSTVAQSDPHAGGAASMVGAATGAIVEAQPHEAASSHGAGPTA